MGFRRDQCASLLDASVVTAPEHDIFAHTVNPKGFKQ
jgi:hypothetical protein